MSRPWVLTSSGPSGPPRARQEPPKVTKAALGLEVTDVSEGPKVSFLHGGARETSRPRGAPGMWKLLPGGYVIFH